jgi:acyl dehydratase
MAEKVPAERTDTETGMLYGTITDESVDKMRRRIGYSNPTLRAGFVTWPWNEVASADAFRRFAHGYGDLNPLFTDAAYAASTRWGCAIAPPGFEWTMGADQPTDPPPDIAEGTRGALRGIHLFNAGHDGYFFRPIVPGDRLTRSSVIAAVEDKVSSFRGRSVIVTNENRFMDDDGAVVALRRPWYVHLERRATSQGEREAVAPASYSEEDLAEIDAAYDGEYVRGSETLYYEDVRDEAPLPRMVKGPLTVTDLVNFFMGAGWYGYGFPAGRLAYENRKKLRGFYARNEFGAWDAIMRIHWENDAARAIGVPAAYDIGPLRYSWLVNYCTHFAGDDGWVHRVRGEFRRFNYVGDTTWIHGEIAAKREDPRLGPLVELSLRGVNQRGDENILGQATILLPSRRSGPVTLPEAPGS